MAFREADLRKKLQVLSASQQSIQTLSMWCRHHHKHAAHTVRIWQEEFVAAKPAKKLPLMYLCNDILLEKNSPQQLKEALKKSLVVALKDGFGMADAKFNASVERMINIWGERKAFAQAQIDEFMACVPSKQGGSGSSKTGGADVKARARQGQKGPGGTRAGKAAAGGAVGKSPKAALGAAAAAVKAAAAKTGKTQTQVEISSLHKLLVNTATASEQCEQAFKDDAALPPEISNDAGLLALTDQVGGQALKDTIKETRSKLERTKTSLISLVSRRGTCIHDLEAYLAQQQLASFDCKHQITKCQTMLGQAKQVKKEIKKHTESLPMPLGGEEQLDADSMPQVAELFDIDDDDLFGDGDEGGDEGGGGGEGGGEGDGEAPAAKRQKKGRRRD